VVESALAIAKHSRKVAANDSTRASNTGATVHIDTIAAIDEVAYLVKDFCHLQRYRHAMVTDGTTRMIDCVRIKRVRKIVGVWLEFTRLSEVEDVTDASLTQLQQSLFGFADIRAPGVRPRE
jgi:endo-1,4-beta-mannosidase